MRGAGTEIEPAEEQWRGRVVGEFGDPAGQRPAEALRAERVTRHGFAGRVQGGGALAHAGQRRSRRVEVVAFGDEFRVEAAAGGHERGGIGRG